jgi:hypothetical protein
MSLMYRWLFTLNLRYSGSAPYVMDKQQSCNKSLEIIAVHVTLWNSAFLYFNQVNYFYWFFYVVTRSKLLSHNPLFLYEKLISKEFHFKVNVTYLLIVLKCRVVKPG